MSKSILIIDTPKRCVECQFFAERLCGKGRCTLNMDSNNAVPNKGKPDWCPLRDLPEKIGVPLQHPQLHQLIADGWNACVDEILKGEIDNERNVKC